MQSGSQISRNYAEFGCQNAFTPLQSSFCPGFWPPNKSVGLKMAMIGLTTHFNIDLIGSRSVPSQIGSDQCIVGSTTVELGTSDCIKKVIRPVYEESIFLKYCQVWLSLKKEKLVKQPYQHAHLYTLHLSIYSIYNNQAYETTCRIEEKLSGVTV